MRVWTVTPQVVRAASGPAGTNTAPPMVPPDHIRLPQLVPPSNMDFYPQYCYDSRTVSIYFVCAIKPIIIIIIIWLDIATTVFPELNGKTGTLSRDITAVINTIPAMSAVV